MSIQNEFSAVDCVTEAWKLVKGAKKVFFVGFLAALLCYFFIKTPKVGIIFYILNVFFTFSLYFLGQQRAAGKELNFNMISHVFKLKIFLYLIGYALLTFLLTLMIFLPTLIMAFLTAGRFFPEIQNLISLLLILTTIINSIIALYLGFRIYFSALIIMLDQMPPWPALKKSFKATQSRVGSLLLLAILQMVFFLLGILTLGIGWIWIIPLIFISYGVAYQKLIAEIK